MKNLGEFIKNIYDRLEKLDKELDRIISTTEISDIDNRSHNLKDLGQLNLDMERNISTTSKNALIEEIVKANQPNIEKNPEERKKIQENIEKSTNLLRDQILNARKATNSKNESSSQENSLFSDKDS